MRCSDSDSSSCWSRRAAAMRAGERADRQRPLLVGDPDHDDAVGAVPLGVVVLPGRGELGLQLLQRPGEPGGGHLQRGLGRGEVPGDGEDRLVHAEHRRVGRSAPSQSASAAGQARPGGQFSTSSSSLAANGPRSRAVTRSSSRGDRQRLAALGHALGRLRPRPGSRRSRRRGRLFSSRLCRGQRGFGLLDLRENLLRRRADGIRGAPASLASSSVWRRRAARSALGRGRLLFGGVIQPGPRLGHDALPGGTPPGAGRRGRRRRTRTCAPRLPPGPRPSGSRAWSMAARRSARSVTVQAATDSSKLA